MPAEAMEKGEHLPYSYGGGRIIILCPASGQHHHMTLDEPSLQGFVHVRWECPDCTQVLAARVLVSGEYRAQFDVVSALQPILMLDPVNALDLIHLTLEQIEPLGGMVRFFKAKIESRSERPVQTEAPPETRP